MIPTLLLAVTLTFAAGQAETDPNVRAKRVKAWLEICTAHARDYQISTAAKREEKFELLSTPVFRHGQLVRSGGQDIGAIWLWLQKDGRPGVVGTVFTYPSGGAGYRNVVHELHSLAAMPLTAVWRGRVLWTPQRAGLDWKLIPDAPVPAELATRRLRQARLLSDRFKAHSIDHEGGRWELRLLPKPVYRYQPKTRDSTLGGALFAFCQGTDPEIFLAIEARRSVEGFRWHYACAAFSDYELHVRCDDVEVWDVPKMVGAYPQEPHFGKTVERIRLPEEQ
jgi:hypothetical protein